VVSQTAKGASAEWPRSWRIAASICVAFHVGAVFLAPLSSPPPTTELAQRLAGVIDPYLRGLAINNGYRFFAPEPGPSHLLRYELVMKDGTVTTGLFPDPQKHRPRLYYHRHFMLAEIVAGFVYDRRAGLANPPDELVSQWSEADQTRYRQEREHFRKLQRAIAREVAKEQPEAVRVRLFSQEHLIPSPSQIQADYRLNDHRLYTEVRLVEFTREEWQ
jgi:hypothetical protein